MLHGLVVRRRVLALYFLLALCTPAALRAQSWADPATWDSAPPPRAIKDIIYVPDTDPGYAPKSQRLDVYVNAAAASKAKSPVLVFVHGGGWNHGGKGDSPKRFRAWLAAGFSVVNVEYRLVDAAPAPAAEQDVRCALAWVKQNADKYNFDLSRIVPYGNSAGGHLALLATVLPAKNDIDLPHCKDQPHIAAVLDFYGVYHLEADQPGAYTNPSTARWMGPNPQPSLAAKEHLLSPSTYIRPGLPPMFIAQGDADPVVPYQASVSLHADLDKAGVKNMFDTVPGGLHGNFPPEQEVRIELDSLRFLQANKIIP